jgi:hypothetical protein
MQEIAIFIDELNGTFTVLKNSRFRPALRDQINPAAIVAPYGEAMVTVLRTPARPNESSTATCTWS